MNHSNPEVPCSLLRIKTIWTSQETSSISGDDDDDTRQQFKYEVSTEPSSRASVLLLRNHLNESLVKHQAKATGLCPIRRAIYEQLFDELIRQVTVNCVEQGLLLFRVRNELRMTMNCFRRAYESGVEFGLAKAVEAERELEHSRKQMSALQEQLRQTKADLQIENRIVDMEVKNKLESLDRMHDHYSRELVEKNRVIERQRAIIQALSEKTSEGIRSPELI